jgi:hypothetical protein
MLIWIQSVYLILSVGMTVYVAQTLYKSGRIFLVRTFHADEAMADSVNHLLVVGFYLINIGWMLLWTKYGEKPSDLNGAVEFITTKVGVAMLILGIIHFLNLELLWKIRKKSSAREDVEARRKERMENHG